MAMTLQQRVAALDHGTAYRRTVIGALSTHAKWVLRADNQPADQVALANAVLRAPDAYAVRFGIAALTEPVYDEVEATEDILDAQVLGTIAELWPLFVESDQA